jgi:hypothetical protein
MWRENLEEKWHAPGVRQPFVQACTVRNAHGDLTRVDYWRFYRKITAPQERDNRFVRACALEMHMDLSQLVRRKSHFTKKNTCKMPQTKAGTTVLRERARSKCIWTYQKNRFYARILK